MRESVVIGVVSSAVNRAVVMLSLCGMLCSTALRAADNVDALPDTVDFNRDIRSILSDTCFQCHGPDEAKREAELRLDTKAGAFVELDGHRVIVPNQPAGSELFRRITAEDADERMPPADAERKLTARQIELIRRWIEQGAKWEEHWSFVAPQRPALPTVQNAGWPRSPIDYFILARLERERLAPSAETEKTTLIRRVTLDLTGLPPTPAEVDAFLADDSPDAYEKVVDRLLRSPRYGERMAMQWLDAARYADTAGYQTDGERQMWRWRDWVIEALNRNLPFDQFTVEQLAGDLLPNPTLDQLIATGFNRNHRANSEGGIVFEEYMVEYAVDRVDTTATVWLGLTMGCARCHDHKYDPLLQKDFYRTLAYFNNIPERGRVIKYGNSPPLIKSPTQTQQQQLQELDRELAAARRDFQNRRQELAAAHAAWEASLANSPKIDWSITESLVVHLPLDGDTAAAAGGSARGEFKGGEPVYASGKLGQAVELGGQQFIDVADVAKFSGHEKASFAAWIFHRGQQPGAVLSLMDEEDSRDKGFSIIINGEGQLHVNFGPRWLDDALRLHTERPLTPGRWHHVAVTYDGLQMAGGLKVYVDGQLQPVTVLLDMFTGTFTTTPPLRIGSQGTESQFHGLIDDVRYYTRELSPDEVAVVATAESIHDIATIPADKRTAGQADKMREYFLRHAAPDSVRESYARLEELRKQRAALEESIPTTMVMQELAEPRETFVLKRGEYDKPGEKVSRGVPASLSPLPTGAPSNRLGFAQWLVDPSNPLTSRVAVNRYWQMYFGTGLVKTVEDFGSQGERPSHPELLDWLATEFIRSGWDIKAMQKLIVMSATYRQSSHVTPALLQRDPDNRLLARAPRLRLPAETVRDQALAASGLMTPTIGGPSVKVYQPDGLWSDIASDSFTQDHGDKLYRRSLYIFWKRTVPPPSMTTFDASSRETCIVHRSRTNTPLQALALLNDITYVEAARALAQRMMTEGGDTHRERLAFGFRLITARSPALAESAILLAGFERNLAKYRENQDAATKLVSVGESKWSADTDVAELAAYTAAANLILNLDEAVTK
jgi:hypothetical protein